MGQIFTDTWKDEVKDKFKDRQTYQQPLIYRLVTMPGGKRTLDQIEAWAETLGQTVTDKVTPRLRDERNHRDAYHELAVGHLLRERGFDVVYEKAFPDFTVHPDWYVSGRDNRAAFIVEVLTDYPARLTQEERLRRDLTGELMHRIGQIASNTAIYLRVSLGATLEATDRDALVKEIQEWLKGDPPIREEMAFGAVTVVLGYQHDKIRQTLAMPAEEAFLVDKEPLRKKIERKVKKYKEVSEKLSLPLVVAIVPTFATGRSLDTIADVVHGQEALPILVDSSTGDLVAGPPIRQPGGLFAEQPELSGIIWIEPTSGGELNAHFIPNPHATLPLPTDLIAMHTQAK